MKGAMKMPILDVKEEGASNIGIFTVDPEHPVYQDPFYAKDVTVLASFPLEHRSLDRSLLRNWILVISLFALLLLHLFLGNLTWTWVVFVFGVPLFWIGQNMWVIHTTRNRRRVTHIAIATTGIYLDEVTAPGSRVLKNRQTFNYEDFQQCFCGQIDYTFDYDIVEYKVMLKSKYINVPPFCLVKGILGTQVFADKVNAMIAQVAGETTGSIPIQVAEHPEFGNTVKQGQIKEYSLINENDALSSNPECSVNQDPFFVNENSVFASFPLDQHYFDKPRTFSYVLLLILMVLFFVLIWLGSYTVMDTLIYVACIPLLFFFMVLFYFLYIQRKQYLRRCTHIAIAQTGIYVDVVSAPGSRIHMSRSVYLYGDYRSCYLEEGCFLYEKYHSFYLEEGRCSKFFGGLEHRVMLKKKNHEDPPVVVSWGLLDPQLFVEKVQAMIEQVEEQSTHTTSTTM
jgi:hypothetical protein